MNPKWPVKATMQCSTRSQKANLLLMDLSLFKPLSKVLFMELSMQPPVVLHILILQLPTMAIKSRCNNQNNSQKLAKKQLKHDL